MTEALKQEKKNYFTKVVDRQIIAKNGKIVVLLVGYRIVSARVGDLICAVCC